MLSLTILSSCMCTHFGFRSKLEAQISSWNMHKCKKKYIWTWKYQDLFHFRNGFFIFFPNFRKSEFGGFEKQEIKLFWPNLQRKNYFFRNTN